MGEEAIGLGAKQKIIPRIAVTLAPNGFLIHLVQCLV
jgi:hypothetical protein